MLIDRGEANGIKVGMVVIEGEGLVIGRIARTEAHLSWVRLINDPRSKLPAKIQNMDKTIGLAGGTYGSLLSLELIPQQEKIKVNDLTVTSNLEQGVPENLPIGLVNQIEESSNAPFKSALIEPLADFKNIKLVSVLNFPTND